MNAMAGARSAAQSSPAQGPSVRARGWAVVRFAKGTALVLVVNLVLLASLAYVNEPPAPAVEPVRAPRWVTPLAVVESSRAPRDSTHAPSVGATNPGSPAPQRAAESDSTREGAASSVREPVEVAPTFTALRLENTAFDVDVDLESAVRNPREASGAVVRASDSSTRPPRASGEVGTPGSTLAEGEAETPPRPLKVAAPEFPRSAEARRLEGWVTLFFRIDTQGRVRSVTVIASEGDRVFEEAAVRAARKWTFEPARHGGQAVPVTAERTIFFRRNP